MRRNVLDRRYRNDDHPVGGTSTAAPSMAAPGASDSESGGQRLGQADYAIYNIAANHPSDFHDIAQGNNSVLCTAGATSCGRTTS